MILSLRIILKKVLYPLVQDLHSPDCIFLNNYLPDSENSFCTDDKNSLKFYINGEYHSDISQYVFKHNDRILVSFGESEDPIELEYVKSLKIYDIPKYEDKQGSKDEIFI